MRRNPEQKKESSLSVIQLRHGIRKTRDRRCGSFITLRSRRARVCEYFQFPTGQKSTALRAENSNSRTITFKSREHEKFYEEYLKKCRYQDVYHRALIYCLGIDRDTRDNVNKIYNFKTGCVKTECLQEGWQTSGSLRIVRMAFNLYCNGTPSVGDYEAEEDQLKECQCYTVEDLFCCGYARYFWEAIKIRYPEYCFYKDWEDIYAEN